MCRLCIVASSATKPSSGNQQTTAFKVLNNTFYNLTHQTAVQSYSKASIEYKNNISYRTTGTENGIIAYSKDTTNEYPYTFENNVSNYAVYYFNPNQGVYSSLKTTIPATKGDFFKTVKLDTWTFIPVDAYSSCGAKR